MDYRDELDRNAHTHGYECPEFEPDCSKCIHQPMCSGENCHFDRKWEPEDFEKKFYRVNECEERLSSELFSRYDIWNEEIDPYNIEGGPFYQDAKTWKANHSHKEFTVRLTIDMRVSARDDIDASQKACDIFGVANIDLEDSDTVKRLAQVDILHQYRMPVEYLCCETGHEYGYEYTQAKNDAEAKFLFEDGWIPDVETNPGFDAIERYDDEEGEWYAV